MWFIGKSKKSVEESDTQKWLNVWNPMNRANCERKTIQDV